MRKNRIDMSYIIIAYKNLHYHANKENGDNNCNIQNN